MAVIRFPDPRLAGPDGIVALGGDMRPETLLDAYRRGIFPWPIDSYPYVWCSPAERGVLFFSNLHIPRRLARLRRQGRFRFAFDEAFELVVRSCAEVHSSRGEGGTWIVPEIVRSYTDLHRIGHAHSIEAWDGDRLAGGLYGVEVDGLFAGESMFYREPGASLLALLHLVDHLRDRGVEWLDIQVMTPHMERLGATPIPREAFLELLERSRRPDRRLFDFAETR